LTTFFFFASSSAFLAALPAACGQPPLAGFFSSFLVFSLIF